MLPMTQRQYSWMSNIEPCPHCSVGASANEQYQNHSPGIPIRNNEDRFYHGTQHNIQLCMVLDGHDGEKAVEFVKVTLAGQLLLHEIVGGPNEILVAIEKAFKETEKNFFLAMDDPIGRRLALRAEISQRAHNSYDAQRHYPQQVEELARLDSQIKGGTTVVLSFVCDNQLYVANVGDSRALLCQEVNGQIMASQLSDDHNVFNPGELNRLSKIGLNSEMLKQYRRLGPFQVTRSIGDYAIKGGYREVDTLSSAIEEPGSCLPFINGPWDIKSYDKAFLILMSDGLYEAYGGCIKTRSPPEVHNALAVLVAEEMRLHKRMDRVAQAVVNRVKEQYRQVIKDGRLDDITLIVQNFSYPMSDLTPTGTDHPDNAFPYPSKPPVNNSEGIFVKEEDMSPRHVTPGSREPIKHLTQGMASMSVNQNPKDDKVAKQLFKDLAPLPVHEQVLQKELRPPAIQPPQLTPEQAKSGTHITPYILFPSGFPFDLTLDQL